MYHDENAVTTTSTVNSGLTVRRVATSEVKTK